MERRWSRREPWAARHEGLQWRCHAAEEEAEEEEEGVALGADLQNQKFQGPLCKSNFSAVLKLK
jgi:hypothetical protein